MHPETFARIADFSLRTRQLSAKGKGFLFALGKYANASTLQTEVSAARMAADLGWGTTKLYEGRRELLENGVIVQLGTSPRFKTAIYEIAGAVLLPEEEAPSLPWPLSGQEIQSRSMDTKKGKKKKTHETSSSDSEDVDKSRLTAALGEPYQQFVLRLSLCLMDGLIEKGVHDRRFRRDAYEEDWLRYIERAIAGASSYCDPSSPRRIGDQLLDAARIAPEVGDFSGINRNDTGAFRFYRCVAECMAATIDERFEISESLRIDQPDHPSPGRLGT